MWLQNLCIYNYLCFQKIIDRRSVQNAYSWLLYLHILIWVKLKYSSLYATLGSPINYKQIPSLNLILIGKDNVIFT